MKKLSPALKISLIYFFAGSTWILLSDFLVNLFYPSVDYVFRLNITKGLVFVLITGLLIYLMTKYYLRKIQKESTQKKAVKEKLKKEETLLSTVAEISPVAIVIINKNGVITYANKRAEEMLTLTKSSLTSRTYNSPEWKITDIDGEEFPEENLPFARVIKTQQPVKDVRHSIELSSGRRIHLSVNATPLFATNSKELTGVVAVLRDITQTVDYEKRLVQSRSTYRGIIDSVREAIFIHDFDTRILDANKQAEEIYGYSLAELVGKTPYDLSAPGKNDFNEIEKVLNEAINGKMKRMVLWSRSSDGRVFPTEVNLVLGKYFGQDVMLAVARDISDRFAMEQEIRRSENKYRLLFENSPHPMFVYEIETLKFLDVNKAAIDKYGYTKEEFLSLTIKEIRPREDIEKLEQYLKENEKGTKDSRSVRGRHKLKNGEIIFVDLLSHGIELEGKKCRIVLANDVTKMIKQENELKESEQKYRRIFENIIDVYFETTLQGVIVEISPSINILSYGHYQREELIGEQITKFYLDKSEREKYIELLKKYKRVDDYEIQLKNKDGKIIQCSITAKLISGENEDRIVGSLRDISVRKSYEEDIIKAKEQAENANRLKSEFLAQMSHEIRTPLNIVLNSSAFIREGLTEEQREELSDIFSILKSSGARIIRTVDSILNMSELQSGSYEPEFRSINLIKDILEELISEYNILAKEKGLELKLHSEIEKPLIHADRYSVGQIFSNLIDNAIKYTPKGKVEIKVSKEDESIVVLVSDTGVGISEEFKPYLFDAFRQEHQGYTRIFEGNGLGLAIVKRFCELNKANIDVQSKVNEGSTFKVRFPMYSGK